MRNIGFDGGSSLCVLGPVSDVILFFDCINVFAVEDHPQRDWSLLTDRLYRRYLRLEELDAAVALMNEVKKIFATVSTSAVAWENPTTKLNPNEPNLADVFARYFDLFAHCVTSAKGFFEDWNSYQPVRIVISDLAEFVNEKERPLEEYDALKGEPFWLH